jgi:T3SS (YopN, CesT) and YbjN peptide-binding chaperone 1/T3SS (YopN, CesT) and YbjN peptide-binding chaperone 3
VTDPGVARAFLLGEVEALEPFGFVATSPVGEPLHVVEVARGEDHRLEVRVPGRPPFVPELPEEVRGRLRSLGFASEKPSDRTRPWTCAVADAAAAVELAQRILREGFGVEAAAALDVMHGNHRAEVEARQRLAAARERVEKVVAALSGGKPQQDADGDYVLPIQDVHVVVSPRAMPGGPVLVRVFAIANVGVSVTPELGLFLARLNFGLMFGRFTLDAEHASIWFDETLLGDQFSDEELRFAIQVVSSTADQWDDRLKQMFGGVTYQEVLKGRSDHAAPTTKPGHGGYL